MSQSTEPLACTTLSRPSHSSFAPFFQLRVSSTKDVTILSCKVSCSLLFFVVGIFIPTHDKHFQARPPFFFLSEPRPHTPATFNLYILFSRFRRPCILDFFSRGRLSPPPYFANGQ